MIRKALAGFAAPLALIAGIALAQAARDPAPEDAAPVSPERVASAVEKASALLKAGEAEEAARVLLPLRVESDDPRLIDLLTEATARAAYEKVIRLEARSLSVPSPSRSEPDRAFAEQQRQLNEILERTIKDLERRLEEVDRALSDHGRAEPITDRLEQSVDGLEREVRDLRREVDRLTRTVELLRWKK